MVDDFRGEEERREISMEKAGNDEGEEKEQRTRGKGRPQPGLLRTDYN